MNLAGIYRNQAKLIKIRKLMLNQIDGYFWPFQLNIKCISIQKRWIIQQNGQNSPKIAPKIPKIPAQSHSRQMYLKNSPNPIFKNCTMHHTTKQNKSSIKCRKVKKVHQICNFKSFISSSLIPFSSLFHNCS